jgi:hypothetical protein
VQRQWPPLQWRRLKMQGAGSIHSHVDVKLMVQINVVVIVGFLHNFLLFILWVDVIMVLPRAY